MKGVIRYEVGNEKDFEREYVVNANLIVMAMDEDEAIEKVKQGMIEDITIVNIIDGEWGS